MDQMRRFFIVTLFIFIGFCPSAFASVERDVETWLQLRDMSTCYNFSLYRSFLQSHPDWPEQNVLRVQAEQALSDTQPDSDVITAWFKNYPPLSDNGRFLYFKALVQQGRRTDAQTYLNQMWAQGAFNGDQQDALMRDYRAWISSASHAKRVDALIWAANTKRAEKAISYVGGTTRQIALSRLALQKFDSRALNNLPNSQDPGFLYDLARFYRQRGQDERAAMILGRHKETITEHGSLWWKERAILARRALERGDFPKAYQLAASHGQMQGAELADAEWLAGWLAVSRLGRADRAIQHFDRMYRAVKTPISVARAAYWAGIAATKLNQQQVAQQWYRIAAQHMHTFYGQMAAYALGDAPQYYAVFFKKGRFAPQANMGSGLAQAAAYLYKKGREKERDIFLTALLNKNKDVPQNVISVAKQVHSPKMSLAAAKAAYEKGVFIPDALFPRLTVPKNKNVETALTLGIIRQESMFDPYAQSSARAMGLMQLLPGTADHVARKNGLAHRNTSQLFNAQHNMVLGQAYLASLLDRYGGNVPLSAAAYNAGPGNVSKWIEEMGDPVVDPHSWVDWVERIPFYETRNYVQRVWEAYQVYKYMDKR